jgi:hypothetical protein
VADAEVELGRCGSSDAFAAVSLAASCSGGAEQRDRERLALKGEGSRARQMPAERDAPGAGRGDRVAGRGREVDPPVLVRRERGHVVEGARGWGLDRGCEHEHAAEPMCGGVDPGAVRSFVTDS